jgi:hypothetical protein
MSAEKKIVFYYSTTKYDSGVEFRCLDYGADKVYVRSELDFKTMKNFSMNSNYKKCDKDLFQFRNDQIYDNEDILKHYFKNGNKQVFKINLYKYNGINNAVYSVAIMNSDQKKINQLSKPDAREFELLENCLSCGLMSVDKRYLGQLIHSYGYDFSKFYYNMFRKIRIPVTAPVYSVLETLDFDNLKFGIYRVKVICENKQFWNIFKFNDKHHYNYTTLKTLYLAKDKYDITFKLLEVDSSYNYNFVHYEQTVELKVLFKQWFKVCDELLLKCHSKNKLLKTYVAQAWSTLAKYKKVYVHEDDVHTYNWGHLNTIFKEKKYEYYAYEHKDNVYELVKADDAFKYGGLGRIKAFITEFSRNYMFKLINDNNLQKWVVRIQTDSIAFCKPVNFPAMNLDYYPIAEDKTTGLLTYYNVNHYKHWCEECQTEYIYKKKKDGDEEDEDAYKYKCKC